MVAKLGHRRASILYCYLESNKDMLTGLQELSTDSHVHISLRVMEVYYHHLIANEIDELKRLLDIGPPIEKRKYGVSIQDLVSRVACSESLLWH